MTATAVVQQQHLEALDRANAVRLARAQAKRDIAAGNLTVIDALDLAECQTMTLADLLIAQHRWGNTRMHRVLTRLRVSQSRRVCQLTLRQKYRLADELERRDG